MSIRSASHSLVNHLYSLYLFDHYQELGRYRLAEQIGLTKDQTRTIIKHLFELGYLQKVTQRQGHTLSSEGKNLLQECQQYMHIPFLRVYFGPNYTVGTKDAVVCLEASGIDQLNTVVLRDEALIAGSMGCTAFFQTSSGEIYLLDVTYPPLPSTPLKTRRIKSRITKITQGLSWENILIIVGTADSIILAQKGALAAGLLLVPNDFLKHYLGNLGLKNR